MFEACILQTPPPPHKHPITHIKKHTSNKAAALDYSTKHNTAGLSLSLSALLSLSSSSSSSSPVLRLFLFKIINYQLLICVWNQPKKSNKIFLEFKGLSPNEIGEGSDLTVRGIPSRRAPERQRWMFPSHTIISALHLSIPLTLSLSHTHTRTHAQTHTHTHTHTHTQS